MSARVLLTKTPCGALVRLVQVVDIPPAGITLMHIPDPSKPAQRKPVRLRCVSLEGEADVTDLDAWERGEPADRSLLRVPLGELYVVSFAKDPDHTRGRAVVNQHEGN